MNRGRKNRNRKNRRRMNNLKRQAGLATIAYLIVPQMKMTVRMMPGKGKWGNRIYPVPQKT